MVVYLDDLLIFSSSVEEHLHHVDSVLKGHREHKLYVSPNKCSLFQEGVELLGPLVGRNGIRVDA